MQFVQPAVVSDAVVGTFQGAMVAQFAEARRQIPVVGDYDTPITEASQVFLDGEAQANGIAELTDGKMVSARSNRLCTILNYQQIISSRDPRDGRHVCGQAIKMHWDNCLGSGCNGHVDLRDIDVARLGVAVHKDWSGACQPDGLRGGENSVRNRDDFVTRSHPYRHKCKPG